jgi:spoIIIJ-associated protein
MDLRVFTEELLTKLGAAYDTIEVSTGHRTVVRVTAPDDTLVGAQGDVLRSINTIARRLAESKGGEEAASFLIDVNGYHESQLESVRQQARLLAQRARLFKHDVEMPPQSAYERLVVHELFADDPEILTQSAGEGKFRHIVLKYKTK